MIDKFPSKKKKMIDNFLYLTSLIRVIKRQTQYFHVFKRGLIIMFYITTLLFVLKENIQHI